MTALLIIALLAVMGLVVWAVVRGLYAFANMKPDELDENGVPKSLAMQNKMMFARVKWQAIAIVLIVIILLARGTGN